MHRKLSSKYCRRNEIDPNAIRSNTWQRYIPIPLRSTVQCACVGKAGGENDKQ